MRRRIFLGIGIMCASILPAVATDLSGTWAVSAIGRPVCTFTQTGNFFRGTCEGPVAKGTGFGVSDPDQIVWTYYWTLNTDGTVGADTFVGRVGPDGSISGSEANTSGQRGPFVMKRKSN